MNATTPTTTATRTRKPRGQATKELCAAMAAEGGTIRNANWHGWRNRSAALASAMRHDLVRFYGSDIGWRLTHLGWKASGYTAAPAAPAAPAHCIECQFAADHDHVGVTCPRCAVVTALATEGGVA